MLGFFRAIRLGALILAAAVTLASATSPCYAETGTEHHLQ
jgi:hypothetical protein